MPAWVEHVMWWHVYPLGFTGAPVRPSGDDERVLTHRLPRIEGWLDHVIGLGLNGLQLGPVFASSTHGYDTTDHYRVDPRLGDEGDLGHLIDTAHAKGVRVLLDGVFNHVSREHPAFLELREKGPEASSANLFRVSWDGWTPGTEPAVDVFEGHDQLVALDHGSPAVEDLVVDVMTYWLERGVDGWRLDAAYAVPPAFWARVLPRVRERFPDAWFTGEVIHGDQRAIVAESTIDSLTQYELWQAIWHGISDRNLFELAHAIGRHDELLDTFVPSTFIGNHDVNRIATAIGADFLPHALAVLCTVAGTPAFYAGDEYGYEAAKEERLGGDDAVRPEFPAAPPGEVDAAAQRVLQVTTDLVALRRRNPWLHTARTDVVDRTNTALVLRTAVDDSALVTALNVGDQPALVPAAGATTVLLGDGELTDAGVQLPARGWAVLTRE